MVMGDYHESWLYKSSSELDRCYAMLQELRSVIVGGALIHKNREGSKHEGQRICQTICDFGGTCARNQSPFNYGRVEKWEEEKKEDRVPTTKIFRYQVCRVPMTIGKSYKVEVLCIVDDIDECHILLGRCWRFPPKVTPQLPKPEVKVKENIVKAEVVDEHIEKIQDLQSYKQHDDNLSTLSFGTTNKVGTLKTCEEIIGFNDDEDVKGFNCELKMDFNVHDLDYGLILRMRMKNQINFSLANKEAIFITIENLRGVDKEHTT
ncbi:hypothetical protein Tco_1266756 [Tanacetum coccineum]